MGKASALGCSRSLPMANRSWVLFRLLEGLYVGVAFHSGGFAYNPVTGMLLAELVAEGKTKLDISSFSPSRFPQDETREYLATTVPQKNATRRRH